MSILQLRILEPSHQFIFFSGSAPVSMRFRGEMTETPENSGDLFFNWYSNLSSALEPEPAKIALNPSEDEAALDFTTSLSVGSHVVTFTAKDKPGSDLESLSKVERLGMTGGPPIAGVDNPCVIHGFVVAIQSPRRHARRRTNLTLQATLQAPTPDLRRQEADEALNRIQYRWRFEPQGNPAGRRSHSLGPEESTFNPEQLVINYHGSLANHIDTGNYTLIFQIEDSQNAIILYETSIPMQITA